VDLLGRAWSPKLGLRLKQCSARLSKAPRLCGFAVAPVGYHSSANPMSQTSESKVKISPMQHLLDLMRTHGSLIVLGAAFLERIGLPIPALAFLALAGYLVVEGALSLAGSLAAATIGTMAADLSWFYVGRRYGRPTLHLFCRLSLNPDYCVGRAEHFFRTRGTTTVLVSKLLPGISMLVPPLAGVLRMPFWRYFLLDVTGSLLWAGTGIGLGVVFGAGVLNHLANIQSGLLLLLLAITVGFALFKIIYRHYLIRRYSVPRVDSGELHDKLASGNEVVVVDLRSEEAYSKSRVKIPGALRIPPAQFPAHSHLVPKDKEVVLYCT
jgi:membrane protein DedA with SNARE-associated domain